MGLLNWLVTLSIIYLYCIRFDIAVLLKLLQESNLLPWLLPPNPIHPGLL